MMLCAGWTVYNLGKSKGYQEGRSIGESIGYMEAVARVAEMVRGKGKDNQG